MCDWGEACASFLEWARAQPPRAPAASKAMELLCISRGTHLKGPISPRDVTVCECAKGRARLLHVRCALLVDTPPGGSVHRLAITGTARQQERAHPPLGRAGTRLRPR